jgi:beta-xylosidase
MSCAALAVADNQTGKWGDQGDGTFRNPILAADYSDPDPVRVGQDYYLVTSTFQMAPGVTVLHSKDLVNWETIGAVFSDVSQLGPDFNWDRMNRYNEGVYAPSLRYHEGKFWVFVNCYSGEGFYMATATNAAGPWTVRQIKDKHGQPLRTHGWTDPCPFWDDDGKAYLASSRPSGRWFGYLFEMTPDGTQLLDAEVDHMKKGDCVFEYPKGGTMISPFFSSEGNKLYKRNGYYYLVHIEFLDQGQGHGTYIFRSKSIYGTKADGTPGTPGDPGKYEVLKFGDSLPGQGGFVDTPDGRWFWIGQFNVMGADGRTPNLVPVTWVDDWPVPGVEITNRQGQFAWQLPKPIAGQPIQLPHGSDEFEAPELTPQWQWNYQPRAGKWSLTERPGFLRLHAFKQIQPGKFFKTGNVVCQRHLRSGLVQTTIQLDLGGMADGQEAGLAHFNGGNNYVLLGIVQTNGLRSIKYEQDGKTTGGDTLPAKASTIWLRSAVGFDNRNTYSYSTDGTRFVPFGGHYELRPGSYRSDLVGIYTFNNVAEAGQVDVDFFHYEVKNR